MNMLTTAAECSPRYRVGGVRELIFFVTVWLFSDYKQTQRDSLAHNVLTAPRATVDVKLFE